MRRRDAVERFVIVLESRHERTITAVKVRKLLKDALRRMGLRCVRITIEAL